MSESSAPYLVVVLRDVANDPSADVERRLSMVERRANGPQHYDRMTALRGEIAELRAAWDKYREQTREGIAMK